MAKRKTHSAAWRAQWIWQPGVRAANTWMRLRKRFVLAARPAEAPARIAADSQYWLWINGQLVVREGGLRRGPAPGRGYHDEIDLAPYLKRGRNVIAALVWYWGRDGFSHADSGRGGFVFEMCPGGRRVATDGSWRASSHPAYGPSKAPNYRLSEWPVVFDARRDVAGWPGQGFDDADWPAAVAKGIPPVRPWGILEPRPVPFWRDYGLTKVRKIPPRRRGTIVVDLPYDMQMTGWLRVRAPAGRRIRIRTDHSRLGPLDWTYVTRDGTQQWEAPSWINGEQLRFRVPEGVKVLGLGWRETGIDTDFAGAFACEDAPLNVLWEKARRTTYVCVRDNYMDCPDRERGQWWGDAVNELLQTYYGFAPRAYAHARKGMLEVARWQRRDGVLYAPVPSGNFDQELPCQMLAGVWAMWQYYRHTADAEAIRIVLPHVKRYLVDVWDKRFDRKGFVVPRGEWVWIDWGKRQDGYRVANALYVIATDAAARMADLVGRGADAAALRQRRDDVAGRFPDALWTGDGFGADDRANALAVLAGLVKPHQTEAVRRLLTRTYNASPYMERFVEQALFDLGDAPAAVARMRRRYGRMIDHPRSTLWELWSVRGITSWNHAWSGGPLYLLSAFVAGVRPIEPGFRRFAVAPQLGGLRQVDCTVPTVHGPVRVAVRDRDDALSVAVEAPSGTSAEVGLAKGDYPYFSIRRDGDAARALPADPARDARFIWVPAGPGKHTVEAVKGAWPT